MGEGEARVLPFASLGGWGVASGCASCEEEEPEFGAGVRVRAGTARLPRDPHDIDPARMWPLVRSGNVALAAEAQLGWSTFDGWDFAVDASFGLAWRRLVVGATVAAHRYRSETVGSEDWDLDVVGPVERAPWYVVGIDAPVTLGVVTGRKTLLGLTTGGYNLNRVSWPYYDETAGVLLLPTVVGWGGRATYLSGQAGVAFTPSGLEPVGRLTVAVRGVR